MRAATLALVLAGSAFAQNWHVPDNLPAAGPCSAVPFGVTGGTDAKYQTRCTAADLGAAANQITGLGFTSCATGAVHFAQIEIVLDHIPATQALSTTFANNLTPAAVTVLVATNYTWNVLADTWCEIGLQQAFAYNGVDDLVVQVTVSSGSAPAPGFHRGTRERIWWLGSAPAPATGTSDLGAAKIEVSMLTARTSSHGVACAGSNGTPRHDLVGSAQPGSALSFAVANGVSNAATALVVGTTLGPPWPVDLGSIGMLACAAYTDAMVALPLMLGSSGTGAFGWTIPNAAPVGFVFYSQFVCLDPGANPFGATTSNYCRAFVGN